MTLVTIFDPETNTKQQIPLGELSPTMAQAYMNDGSICWIDRRKVKLNTDPLHPPFGEEKRNIIRQLCKDLAEVCPFTPEKFEVRFRREEEPERQIRMWQKIAFHYKRLIAGGSASVARKNDYLDLCFQWESSWNKEADGLLETTPLREMTRQEAKELLDCLPIIPSKYLGGYFATLHPDMAALDIRTIHSLNQFTAKAGDAGFIVAVDWMSGRCGPVYGLQNIKDIASGKSPESPIRVVAFVLDCDTPELEGLHALLLGTKGSYEWNGHIYTQEETRPIRD